MIKGNFSIINRVKFSVTGFGFFVYFFNLTVSAQPPIAITQSYISLFADAAVDQMVEHKIPASVILAQAILESGGGNSSLARRSNNHFGIKCHREWGGDTVRKNDDSLAECFRRYNTVEDSYTDHSLFLKSRPRYKGLFNLAINDYKGWCYGLKNCGYATYTCYTEELIGIIERYKLDELDGIEPLPFVQYEYSNSFETKNSKLTLDGFTAQEMFTANIFWIDDKNIIDEDFDLFVETEDEEQETDEQIIQIADNK